MYNRAKKQGHKTLAATVASRAGVVVEFRLFGDELHEHALDLLLEVQVMERCCSHD